MSVVMMETWIIFCNDRFSVLPLNAGAMCSENVNRARFKWGRSKFSK